MSGDRQETQPGDDAGEDDLPAPSPDAGHAEDDATAGERGPSLSRAAAMLRSWRLAWGVAVLALMVAFISLGWAATLAAQERRAQAATERGELVAEQVTTFEGADIDQWIADTQALATGEYAEQVAGLFDEEFREALRDNEVQSDGQVERAYLQQLDGDVAEVFVVARQTSTNVLRDDPVEDELRMDITLRHEEGQWLASNIEVLGPAPAGPGDPGLDDLPDGEDADEDEDDEDDDSDEDEDEDEDEDDDGDEG